MKKTVLFFLRHGAVYNPKNILYGRLPGFPLSDKGRKEVKKTAEKLVKEKIDFIYASPLIRTKQTADIVAKELNLTPKYSRLLLEVNIFCQGMHSDQYKKEIQPVLYEEKYLKLGQESIEAIFLRMTRITNKILRKHNNKKILIISHGDPIVIFKALTSGEKFTYKYKIKNYLSTGAYLKAEYINGNYIWFNQ